MNPPADPSLNDLFALPLKGTVPGVFRAVYDDGFIYRNVELVRYHGPEGFTQNTNNLRLLLIRPILESEALDPKFRGELHLENPPTELTKWLDSFYEIVGNIRRLTHCGMKPNDALAHFVASRYYDCLTGGMPISIIRVIRAILLTGKLDLNTQVYPGENGWMTFQDFLKDTAKHNQETPEKIREITPLFLTQ